MKWVFLDRKTLEPLITTKDIVVKERLQLVAPSAIAVTEAQYNSGDYSPKGAKND